MGYSVVVESEWKKGFPKAFMFSFMIISCYIIDFILAMDAITFQQRQSAIGNVDQHSNVCYKRLNS